MTNLDPRSMIALAGFMSAVMAMVLLFMRRHYTPPRRALGPCSRRLIGIQLSARRLPHLRQALPRAP